MNIWHRNDAVATQITGNSVFVKQFVQNTNNGDIQFPRYWPFVRGPSVTGAFPAQRAIMLLKEFVPPDDQYPLVWCLGLDFTVIDVAKISY